MELEPSYPDNYFHYLDLVVFLNMEKLVNSIAEKAVATPGVTKSEIYDLVGLFEEKNKNWSKALDAYQKAFIEVINETDKDDIEQSIKRVKLKIQRNAVYQYHLTG